MPDQYLATSRRISSQFIAYLVGRLSIDDFAEWVRQTPELTTVLSPTDYTELMSIDFQHAKAPSLLDRLLRGYIDWAQYEKEQLAELLMAIIWKDDLAASLATAQEQFKHGLRFMNVLSNEYGKSILSTQGLKKADERLLASVYPKVCDEAKRLLACLVAGKIKFTGTYTSEGYPEYVEV
ncbi:hypothetical protein [Fibrella arboris]|uniref:hypothetical protein n=1 Tax=Fibrella arboris TaxID=3242486 RepID=UPI0035229859